MSYISQAFPMGILDRDYTLSHYSPEDPYAHAYMREHPVGTGPYRLSDWDVGTKLTLVQNRNYWGGWEGVHARKVILKSEPSDTVRLDVMRRGNADAVEIPPHLSGETDATKGVDAIDFPTARIEVVAMNFMPLMGGQSFMTDPLVRKAFCFAFDYSNITLRSYNESLARMSGCLPDVVPLASESQPSTPFAFNLTEASELLNASGRMLDTRGLRFNGSAIRLAYETGSYERMGAAQHFASDLRRLGAEVDVFETDHPGTTVGRAWDMYMVSLQGWYLDPDYFVTALAVSTAHGGDVMRTGVANDIIDAAEALASISMNKDSRISNYSTIWRELSQTPNMIYVGQASLRLLVGDHVDVLYVHPITHLDLYQTRET
jgi:peptide/nickel transport system substrate-binding protein